MDLFLLAAGLLVVYLVIAAISSIFLGTNILTTYTRNNEILQVFTDLGISIMNTRNLVSAVKDQLAVTLGNDTLSMAFLVDLNLGERIAYYEGTSDSLGSRMNLYNVETLSDISQKLHTRSIMFEDYQTNSNFSLSFKESLNTISVISRELLSTSRAIASKVYSPAIEAEKKQILKSTSLSILVNSIQAVLPKSTELLEAMRQDVLLTELKAFNLFSLLFFIAYIILVVFSTVLFFVWQFKTNKTMYNIVDTFSLLTLNECNLHLTAINKKMKIFSQFMYSESEHLAVTLFKKNNQFAQVHSKTTDTRTQRVKYIRKDRLNLSFLSSMVVMAMSVGFFTIFGVIMYNSTVQIVNIFNLQTLYLDHCKNMIGLSNRYNYFGSMLLYGFNLDSKIRLDSKETYETALKNFSSYWIDNASENSNLLGNRYIEIERMLYDRICSLIPESSTFSVFEKQTCDNFLDKGSANGLIHLLIQYEQILSSYLTQQYIPYQNVTNPLYELFDSSTSIWFKEDIYKLNTAFSVTTRFFFESVQSSILQVTASFLNSINTLLNLLYTVGSLTLTVLIITASFVLHKMANDDWEICYETFKVISPHIVTSNAYISSVFKRYFYLGI